MKNHTKLFSLITFTTKACLVQKICDTVNGFIRDYDGTKYLVLFGLEKYDAIYDRIRYLIGLKSGITYIFLIIMQKSKLIQMMNCL